MDAGGGYFRFFFSAPSRQNVCFGLTLCRPVDSYSYACILWGRPRRGAELSTAETFDSVLACLDKGCFNAGRDIAQLYFEDRVGEQTGLPFYCKTISTSGNEALHRFARRVPLGQLFLLLHSKE